MSNPIPQGDVASVLVPQDSVPTLLIFSTAGGSSTEGGGVSVHAALTGRSVADGHPIAAITGLQVALDAKSASGHTHTGVYDPAGTTATHAANTSNPHSVTAAQVGADPTGTAAAAVVAHTGATDPHGDRAFATSAVSTHSALTTGAHGITAAGAALLDDADAAAQRTTLGLGTAALSATGDFEAAGAVSTHNAVTTAHGISAYGATLVDDADAATARTTLGLGTAATTAATDYATASHNHSGVYQPADAELTAIAGLTSAADSAPYFTGSGTAGLMTVTAAGRAILDDADASAQRATLGLGTAATTAATDYATAAQGTDDRTASGLRSASTVVSVSAATAPSSGQVLTATSSTAATWQTPSGGGSGDVVGPASATDNAIARFDTTTGKLLQNSGVTVSDVSGSSVTVASTPGNALAIAATAPAATTGASVAGVAASVTAGPAVASTDTAGAAAGGSVTITAGAAARLTSGNANGGNISLVAGTGIGTGTDGQILIGSGGTTARPALAFDIGGNTAYGMWYSGGAIKFSVNGTEIVGIVGGGVQMAESAGIAGNAATPGVLYGLKRQFFALNSSTTLTSGHYNGSTITNSTAGAAITSTLITAAVGYTHRFVDDNATYRWTIKPNTADTIIWTDGTVVTAATGSIVSTGRYDSFEVEALDATVWLAYNVRGTWTVTP